MSSQIKTFNSAKKFAEEVLHPLIKSHSEAKLTTRLGAISITEANSFSPAQRTIGRYNATKERVILQQTLINEIEATVLINGVKSENELLEKIKKNLELIETNFDSRKDEIMEFITINGTKSPKLLSKFNEINKFLDKMYVQVQRVMTKNKLLFTSDNEDFLEDQELKEKIKTDNLRA